MSKHGLYFPIVFEDGKLVEPELMDSITSSIRHILAWPRLSRYFNPRFGSGLHKFLGGPLSLSTLDLLRIHIKLILNQEPRIEVKTVSFQQADLGQVIVLINAYVKALQVDVTFETSI